LKYTVILSRQAEHFYKKLEENDKTPVRENPIILQHQPRLGKHLHGDIKENYSLRIGKLPIIYPSQRKTKPSTS
jgi:mRNA-degrading endonuclease RelE of RelBE toxin-antitoxin system